MELLFKRAQPPRKWETVIALATGGPYCHVEARLADGRCFSSNAPEGVRFVDSIANEWFWDIVKVPWEAGVDALAWAASIVGCGYAYLTAFASAYGKWLIEAGKWICSQTVLELLTRCPGGPQGIPPLIHPNGLYIAIQNLLRPEARVMAAPMRPEVLDEYLAEMAAQ